MEICLIMGTKFVGWHKLLSYLNTREVLQGKYPKSPEQPRELFKTWVSVYRNKNLGWRYRVSIRPIDVRNGSQLSKVRSGFGAIYVTYSEFQEDYLALSK